MFLISLLRKSLAGKFLRESFGKKQTNGILCTELQMDIHFEQIKRAEKYFEMKNQLTLSENIDIERGPMEPRGPGDRIGGVSGSGNASSIISPRANRSGITDSSVSGFS